jgi:hypothetical protein
MSFIYCDTCCINILHRNLHLHNHLDFKHCLIEYFPTDIINIIYDYKTDIELYTKYHKFYKFVDYFKNIKNYIQIGCPVEYSCYSEDHYIKDIYQMLYYEFEDFKNNNCIRHYNHKKKININTKRKIFKIFLFFNYISKKYVVEIL